MTLTRPQYGATRPLVGAVPALCKINQPDSHSKSSTKRAPYSHNEAQLSYPTLARSDLAEAKAEVTTGLNINRSHWISYINALAASRP